MKKIKLEIMGLSYSQTQSGAYALVLGESEGNRRLPIIIGGCEAQAIAIQLEKLVPTRPLTHDLFKSLTDAFNIRLLEVLIYSMVEGVFYARLICTNGESDIEIDARTSDAVALAVRYECPIYANESILEEAGVNVEDEGLAFLQDKEEDPTDDEEDGLPDDDIGILSVRELKERLTQAIENEEYEKAARLRDELSNRSAS